MTIATRFLAGITAAGITVLGLGALPALADDDAKILRIGTWLPAHHLLVQDIIRPWADAIEAETDGSLKFEIMAAPLGPPPATFDLLTDGSFDVGYGVSGHNPGRFTMTQVMDLPFASPDPWSGSAAAWATYKRYGAEYGEHEGAHLVGLFTHSTPLLHSRSAPFATLADLKGKKIRVGGNVTGQMIEAMGGTPVQLPPTEAQNAMARGVADGITFPNESVDFFGITPAIKASTFIPGGLYTDTFWVAFNERSWDGLSPEQQAAVEKHSGMAIALLAGWAWTNADITGEENMRAAGVEFSTWSDEDVAAASEAMQPMRDAWIAEADKRGLPGQEILDYAQAMVAAYRADKSATDQ